jgi:hypothetical protein
VAHGAWRTCTEHDGHDSLQASAKRLSDERVFAVRIPCSGRSAENCEGCRNISADSAMQSAEDRHHTVVPAKLKYRPFPPNGNAGVHQDFKI